MFSFGDDDKDKLKENMEQIKQMINEGESMEEAPPNQEPAPVQQTQSPEPDIPEDDIQPESEPMEPEPQQENLLDQKEAGFQEPVPNQDQGIGQREVEETAPADSTGSETATASRRRQQSEKGKPEVREQQRKNRGRETGTRSVRNLNEEIPSPPENKEVEVPEIEKGPLFIRQRKFRRAREMLREMMYLSGEIQETVNSLEAGIQEDHQTENQVREMLQEFETDRSEVEDIVSPEE